MVDETAPLRERGTQNDVMGVFDAAYVVQGAHLLLAFTADELN